MNKFEAKNRLFLIDALALIYHAYRNSSERNNSTISGFFAMLERILLTYKPTHIAVAFDIKKPTFRHKLDNKYKANRKKMPVEIQNSLPIIKNLLVLLNIQSIELEGYEADDIIGTLAKKASSENYKVYIVSPDKDFFQLINENTSICKLNKPGKEVKIIGLAEVRNRFTIANTSQIPEIMALCGDKSDNILGIPGLGSRNARKLISQFGTIDEIYNKLETLNAKQKELFFKFRAQVELSKKLVTIDTKIPLSISLESLKIKNYSKNEIFEILDVFNQHQKFD